MSGSPVVSSRLSHDIARVVFLVVALAGLTRVAAQSPPVHLDDMARAPWTPVAPGVWSAHVGAVDAPLLSEFAGAPPALAALSALPKVAKPPIAHDPMGLVYGTRTTIRLGLGEEERLYGMGLQFGGMNRRDEVYHLQVDHFGGVRGRTHAPVPLYVSSRGYAVFFDTSRYLDVYLGIGNRRDDPALPPIRDRNTDPAWDDRPTASAVEASVVGPGLRVLIFAGPSPLQAVQRYVLYFGGGCLPPKWGLGFWHRVPTNATAAEITAEVARFDAEGFPLDVLGLEPGWQSKAYPGTFDWNREHFPEPKEFVNSMEARGVHINLWENPYVSPESSIYEALLPHTGSHMVWLGVVPDYTLAAAREILQKHHEAHHLAIGVSGYKIDEVDGIDAWLWPDHAVFPSGVAAEQMRQTYGLQLQATLMPMFRARNHRTYGLVRGTNGAAPAYPFALYSDTYNHRQYVAAVGEAGLSGVLWAPEIRSARTAEEWVRRMQSACMSPLAQLNAWSDGTKPWSFPEVNEAIRSVMLLRQRLVPYLYSAFAQYRFRGVPPFRPMVLDDAVNQAIDNEAIDADYRKRIETASDQYFMGPNLLVAPVFAGQTAREVVLPPGRWYDFYTGAYAGEREVISIEAPLETIPVFVRDGGVIPLGAPELHLTARDVDDELEVRHYGTADGFFALYEDDGLTFDYESGAYTWTDLQATRKDGRWESEPKTRSTDAPIRWTMMTREANR